jgi:ATP-dependent DNA helicase RecQ
MCINILRGAKTADLYEKGYQNIKTYGAGADLSFSDWQHFMTQLLNTGVFETAYDQNFNLKITEFGESLLKNEGELKLTRPLTKEEIKYKEKKTATKKNKSLNPDQQLFEELKVLRKSISKEKGLPAYIIFHDATLKEMSSSKPKTAEEMMQIQGLGEAKFRNYGQVFLDIIQQFEPKIKEAKKKKGDTYKETLDLYNQGLSPEEISISKDVSSQTVFNHLIKLRQDGFDIDLSSFITSSESESITEAYYELKKPAALKPIFEHFNGELSYEKIKIALIEITQS